MLLVQVLEGDNVVVPREVFALPPIADYLRIIFPVFIM